MLDVNRHDSDHSWFSQRGFTLIEIMLVIALIAVSVAMIAPSFMRQSAVSLKSEGRRMQQTLRLLVEEVELTGVAMRWSVTYDGYRFASLGEKQQWQEMSDAQFGRHLFSETIKVTSFHTTTSSGRQIPVGGDKEQGKEKVEYLGHVFFWPGGGLDISNITIADKNNSESLSVELRPGPGNIKIVDGEL